jgi:hypothetical protein
MFPINAFQSLVFSIFAWVLWLPTRAFIDLESDFLLDLVLSITPAKLVLPLVPKDCRGYPAGKATSLTHPLRRDIKTRTALRHLPPPQDQPEAPRGRPLAAEVIGVPVYRRKGWSPSVWSFIRDGISLIAFRTAGIRLALSCRFSIH